MKVTRPKLVFVCESALSVIKESRELEKVPVRIIVIGRASGFESLNDIMKIQTEEEVRAFDPLQRSQQDGISMIFFSSGTTGPSKAVAHSHETLRRLITVFTNAPSQGSVYLVYSPLDWISGSLMMLLSIVTSRTKILHNNFDPDEMCQIIEKYQVNWVFIPSAMINYLNKSKAFLRYQCKSLACFMTAGSKLTKLILEELRDSLPHILFFQFYGMTELGGGVTAPSRQSKNIESLGYIMPNMQFKVIDPMSGEALGPNQHGEICAKSPNIMLGYYNDPSATQAIIDREGWLHTGDKGYYTSNGELFVVDRLKEIMKYKGRQVSPSEIEDLLITHPAVMEVAVVSLPHEMDGDLPMAFVKRCEGREVTKEELVELSSQLGEYKKLWGGVRFVDQMPHTPSGKINRKALKDMANNSC